MGTQGSCSVLHHVDSDKPLGVLEGMKRCMLRVLGWKRFVYWCEVFDFVCVRLKLYFLVLGVRLLILISKRRAM